MSLINLKSTRIVGVGAYVPDHIVTNDDLSKIVDTNDEWITSRTGIKERHIVSDNEGTTSLSVKAAHDALGYAGLNPSDIDLIISATSIPDNLYPSTACEVQGAIGAHNAVAFNIVAACSGFIYALKVAHALLSSGSYKRALVIGADVHSRFVDWNDRTTCILFGDGAGAMIIENTDEENEIYTIDLNSDGAKSDLLKIPLNGNNNPFTKNQQVKKPYVSMNGKEIYKFSIKVIPNAVKDALNNANIPLEKLDYLIPHQANIRIIEAMADKLCLRKEQLIANLHKFGNTSAASIPIALVNAIKDNQVKTPSNMVMVGFGSGLTWGVAVIKWTALDKRN